MMEHLRTAFGATAHTVRAPYTDQWPPRLRRPRESVWRVGVSPTLESDFQKSADSDGILEFPLFTLNPRQYQFYTYVGVGTPLQYMRVVFDTTSSDLSLLGFNRPQHEPYEHNKSSTFVANSTIVRTAIPGTMDIAMGFLSQDRVALIAGEAILSQQFFTEVQESSDATQFFDGTYADGWIGLGRSRDQEAYPVPSLLDRLIRNRLVKTPTVGIHLNPLSTGLVTVGAVNDQLFHGNLTFVNVEPKKRWDTHHPWSFRVDGVLINNHPVPPPSPRPPPPADPEDDHHRHSVAVLDSVLPMITGPSHIVEAVNNALGQTEETARVPCGGDSGAVPVNLTLVIGGTHLTVQRDDLVASGLGGSGCVSILTSSPRDHIHSLEWRLGAPFMQAFYTALEFGEVNRIGFAPSKRNAPPAFSAYDSVWLLLLGVVLVLIGRSLGRKSRDGSPPPK